MNNYYFDNAATSWPKPENVYRAYEQQMRSAFGNPGRSGHSATLETERLIYKTRAAVSSLFNIKDPGRVVFTLNATDAINMALKGYLKQGDHVLHSAIDHNAVLRPLARLEEDKVITTTTIPCSEKGYPDIDFLEAALKRKTSLLVINHASNVTGAIAPLDEMIKLAHANGAKVLVDAAQTAGALPIDAQKSAVDMLAFTGHKSLLGPTGTGGLYVRPGLDIRPWREGGTGSRSELVFHPQEMPERLEAGTLNSAGLAGLLEGILFIKDIGTENIKVHEQNLRAYLYNKLAGLPKIKLFGPAAESECTLTLSVTFSGVDNAQIGYLLESNFSVISRTGLHCAPLAHQAINTYPEGTIRFSPGYFSTTEDIDCLTGALQQITASL